MHENVVHEDELHVPNVDSGEKPVSGDKDVQEMEALLKAAANAPSGVDEIEQTSPKSLSREELEAVADDGGISGLRAIAEPLGVKSNSIDGLIDAILKASQ